MAEPSNPAPLYPAFGWVANLLVLYSPPWRMTPLNLCVLPRAPPTKFLVAKEIYPKIKAPAWWVRHSPSGLGEDHGRATRFP